MSETLPPRHTLHKAIELARDERGRIYLHCEKCDHIVNDGESWCCQWSLLMFWNYFYGRIQKEKVAA
jgi:hypothetical protein